MRRVRLPPTSSLCTLSLSASLTDLDMADRVRQLLATTCWSSIFLLKKRQAFCLNLRVSHGTCKACQSVKTSYIYLLNICKVFIFTLWTSLVINGYKWI